MLVVIKREALNFLLHQDSKIVSKIRASNAELPHTTDDEHTPPRHSERAEGHKARGAKFKDPRLGGHGLVEEDVAIDREAKDPCGEGVGARARADKARQCARPELELRHDVPDEGRGNDSGDRVRQRRGGQRDVAQVQGEKGRGEEGCYVGGGDGDCAWNRRGGRPGVEGVEEGR